MKHLKSIVQDKSGFSLLELMIVATIIGILATIAIPNYKSFMARARQKEGFNLLNSYYAAATNTRAEFGVFPGDFVQTGFQPVGQLGYRLRAENGTMINIGAGLDDDNCTHTQRPCTCSGACNGFKTWNEMPAGAMGAIGVGSAHICPATSNTMFTVIVSGWISTDAATPDRYNINEQKTIVLCSDGLK